MKQTALSIIWLFFFGILSCKGVHPNKALRLLTKSSRVMFAKCVTNESNKLIC